jgi:hypothetical protein
VEYAGTFEDHDTDLALCTESSYIVELPESS